MSSLKNVFLSLKSKDSFAQNFAVIFSSNVLALVIGFAFTPIIARIYTPEAYGNFGLFLAISQNIGNLATLQLTRAFVLPREEADFFDLIRLSFLSTLFFTVVSFLVFILAGQWVLQVFKAESLGYWLLLVPIAVLLSSMNDIYQSWNIRVKEFRRGAFAKVTSTLTTRLFTLIYGLFSGGSPAGLVIGDLLSKPFDSYFLRSQKIKSNSSVLIKGYQLHRLRATLKQFKSYPLFVLPGNWLNNFSNQLPVYLLMSAFGGSMVGFYAQANSLLNIPMTVLTTSIAPLFLQKAATTFYEDPSEMKRLVMTLYNRLFYVGVVPFCILAVFGEEIFSVFLGERWRMAGVFAGFMGFYFLFWIISSPFNSLYRIYGKEHVNLVVNIITLAFKAVGLVIGIQQKNPTLAILYFSIATFIGHLAHTWIGFVLVRINFLPTLLKSVGVIGAVYTICLLLKSAIF